MKGYRAHLQSAVAASAAPYGYTLTIWTSGAVTTHERGIPTAWQAILFLLGAVLGFGIAAAVAYGRPTEVFASRQHGFVRLWGGFHLLSVGLAIAVVAAVVAIVDSPIVWLLVGLIATTTYLLTIAAQFTLADTKAT
jgi:hypothetical protein